MELCGGEFIASREGNPVTIRRTVNKEQGRPQLEGFLLVLGKRSLGTESNYLRCQFQQPRPAEDFYVGPYGANTGEETRTRPRAETLPHGTK